MTLTEARNYFENLISENPKKAKLKIYKVYTHIISELEKREFSTDQLELITTELEKIVKEAGQNDRNRSLKKRQESFKAFLNDKFSLTLKDHYTNKGIALGMTFGMVFGIIFLRDMERSLGLAMGLSFGMMIGYGVGKYLDQKASKESKVI
ncbi:hypothetical protein [Lutimonas sp.]|uniref:hypothetical protein n=1 Tax=Lutimonas sp. TaxID=1872403 RepID=UPI003D9ADDF5